MRVLQINSFFSVGGPPRIVNGIYDTLIEQGHECKIAAAREEQYVPKDSIPIGNSLETYINAIKARVFDDEGLSARHATAKLIKQIRAYHPDIIQLHNLHGYYINIEILFGFLKEYKKPVVWTFHDCWPFTGHCAYFDSARCDKWVNGCFECPEKGTYPASCVMDRSKRNYSVKKSSFQGVDRLHIITPSKWLANLVEKSFLGCYPIDVINNGIDLDKFSYKQTNILDRNNLQGKRIVLGVAQNWAGRKGFEDFIQLSELLDDSYRVVMIGLTDDLIRKTNNKIICIKKTNSIEELVEWYSAAEAFINLTYEDNFPTVNIEALACGTPVITYDTGGSPEAIDETCGIIVEQGNVNGVKDALYRLSKEENKRNNCFERSKMFGRETKYREYIKLYGRLVGENV